MSDKLLTGPQTEALFKTVMGAQGKKVSKSTPQQDMYDHIDFFVDGVSYDVKGKKLLMKHGTDIVIWVEDTNVRGNTGWLHGKADIISFHVGEEFWDIERTVLVDYIAKEITNPKVFKIQKYKKWYSRDGRGDKITYVHNRDIEPLVINKYKVVI